MKRIDRITRIQRYLIRGDKALHTVVPTGIAGVLQDGDWRGRLDRNGEPFKSFRAFVEADFWEGLATPYDKLVDLCQDAPEVHRQLLELDPQPENEAGPGRGHKTLYNIQGFSGTKQSYIMRRLMRDDPELADRVFAGELSAHKAAVQAGFRKKYIQVPDDLYDAVAKLEKHFAVKLEIKEW